MKFKIIACLVFTIFLTGIQLLAQKNSNGFSAGGSAGLNFCDVSDGNYSLGGFGGFSSSYSTSPLLRLNFGLWGKYNLQENLDLHVAFLYSGLGYSFVEKINSGGPSQDFSGKVVAPFLQFPIYAGYTFYKQGSIKVSGLLGGYGAISAGNQTTYDNQSSNKFRPKLGIDLGLSFGANVDVTENISVMTTYNFGLINAEYYGKNRFLQLSVIYYFFKT